MKKKKVKQSKRTTNRISKGKLIKASDLENNTMLRSALKELNLELKTLNKKRVEYQKKISSINTDVRRARQLEKAISKRESKLETARKNLESRISKLSGRVIRVKRIKEGLLIA